MNKINKIIVTFIMFAVLISVSIGKAETLLSISNVIVTDVTDVQFSVVWASNQPGLCYLNIFSDSSATNDVTSQFSVISESALQFPAEDNGVMKVTVKGAKPDTTYYFKTVTTAKLDNKQYISNKIFKVTTEKNTAVMNNNTVVQAIYSNDGDKKAYGTLLIASVPNSSYPLTAWVGDGYPGCFAGVDFSNLYKANTRKSFDINSGLNITLWGFGGILGYAKTQTEIDETYDSQLVNVSALLDPGVDLEL